MTEDHVKAIMAATIYADTYNTSTGSYCNSTISGAVDIAEDILKEIQRRKPAPPPNIPLPKPSCGEVLR